jgi:hypothetical protein
LGAVLLRDRETLRRTSNVIPAHLRDMRSLESETNFRAYCINELAEFAESCVRGRQG